MTELIIFLLLLIWFFAWLFTPLFKEVFGVWENGTCLGRIARRHKYNKSVQFLLIDIDKNKYWYNFSHEYWIEFNRSFY